MKNKEIDYLLMEIKDLWTSTFSGDINLSDIRRSLDRMEDTLRDLKFKAEMENRK